MTLPANYTIEHRDVKHVRLRVQEDGSVLMFVPNRFTDEEVHKVIEMKAEWIASKQRFFQQKSKILLKRNELLLFGNRYAYYYSSQYKNKVVVNVEGKTIQARKNLLDIPTQEKWLKSVAGVYIRPLLLNRHLQGVRRNKTLQLSPILELRQARPVGREYYECSGVHPRGLALRHCLQTADMVESPFDRLWYLRHHRSAPVYLHTWFFRGG